MQRNNRVFLLDKSALEIINAAGYPRAKQITVETAAKNIESHKIFIYRGSKNFLKFSNVNCMVVSPLDCLVVMEYNNTKKLGNTMNNIIHNKYGYAKYFV